MSSLCGTKSPGGGGWGGGVDTCINSVFDCKFNVDKRVL